MSFKKFFIFVHLFLISIFAISAQSQQITKFAVVDTAKVYQAYYRNSAPVRNYESKKQEFQNKIDSLIDELQKLHDKELEYKKNNNESMLLSIQSQITQKTDFLNEYTNAKNIELESLKTSLQNNDAFYKKLYETLSSIAESGGYTMVLSLQQNNSILWYSPSVDITELVISRLAL